MAKVTVRWDNPDAQRECLATADGPADHRSEVTCLGRLRITRRDKDGFEVADEETGNVNNPRALGHRFLWKDLAGGATVRGARGWVLWSGRQKMRPEP